MGGTRRLATAHRLRSTPGGSAYTTAEASNDPFFFRDVDAHTKYQTQSLIAVPVRIEHEVCGVLELINRKNRSVFSDQDKNLLEVFAGYISISIQNVLDARQAQEIAKRDNLTGLFNDRYLHIVLSQEIRRCREESRDLAILFLDLDFFKRVNDTHGHLAGSQVLREVGQILRHKVSIVGGISARYGGDEFVILLPGQDLDRGIDIAEEVRTTLVHSTFSSKPGEIQSDPLNLKGITCSIGIATLRRHLSDDQSLPESKSMLLRLADAAMYVAKETGRNRTAVAGQIVPRRRDSPSATSELLSRYAGQEG